MKNTKVVLWLKLYQIGSTSVFFETERICKLDEECYFKEKQMVKLRRFNFYSNSEWSTFRSQGTNKLASWIHARKNV